MPSRRTDGQDPSLFLSHRHCISLYGAFPRHSLTLSLSLYLLLSLPRRNFYFHFWQKLSQFSVVMTRHCLFDRCVYGYDILTILHFWPFTEFLASCYTAYKVHIANWHTTLASSASGIHIQFSVMLLRFRYLRYNEVVLALSLFNEIRK